MKRNSKILIVDDELAGRETLVDLLDGQSYNLVFANNGAEALEKVAKLRPDLVLLDVMMPGMDGFEICHQIKAEKAWQHIPIILITALDGKKDLVRGLDAGADDFLSKPVHGMELRARVRSMLRSKTQYDLLEKQRRELEASLRLNERFSEVFAQHLEALEILHNTGIHMMSQLDTDSVLSLISHTVLDLIPEASGCVVHFLSEEDQELLPVIFSSGNNLKMVYPSIGIEDIVRQTIETRQAVHIPDLTTMADQVELQIPEMRELLVTPLVDGQRPLGALSVYSRKASVFKEGHQHILSILANQAAVAINQARFIKEREQATEREKQAIRQLFKRYVSSAVVDRLVDGRENLTLGGQRQEITVLFADLRGFTTFSEKMAPERLVEVLNQYLALAVDAILVREGMLDKFIGDAVMAVFNAPLPQADHTLRAVQAAQAIQEAIARHNQQTPEDNLAYGIGIHVGQAIVGNIGTQQQMDYTAIGDAVNLAARLQEKAERGQILLSQAAYDAVKDVVQVESLGPVTVKGRSAAEPVYAVVGCIEKLVMNG
ncbi:MAG TPA: adenylate/guanylate cyclase domain-containing protein [Anaerolineae bacterium]